MSNKFTYGVKYLAALAALCLFINVWSSCNKNSDQLPPTIPDSTSLKIPYALEWDNLNFIFTQARSGTHDTEWVALENNSGEDLTNITFFVQMCRSLPQNFTNCNYLKPFYVSLLKSGTTSGRFLLFTDDSLTLNASNINAGIISIDNHSNPAEGLYYSSYTTFSKNTSDSTYDTVGSNGKSMGFVCANGASVFMFSANDTNSSFLFNFTGGFDRTGSVFTGEMMYNQKSVSAVTTRTFSVSPSSLQNATVTWKIDSASAAHDSISTITDVLNKIAQ